MSKSMHIMYDLSNSAEFFVDEQINEATGDTQKKYKIRGIFSTIGEKNRNGRTYPKHLWENEVSKYQDNFKNGSINTLMEWEHPARSDVDPMQAIAKITKLEIQGKYVIGEAVLLDNEKANQLKSLIDNGIKICVSSRGVGSVNNGIVESFKLITYDVVSSPSDFNASMNGLVENYKVEDGILSDKLYTLNESGDIVVVDENNFSMAFTPEEVNNAILGKFKDLLNSK